MYVRTFEQGWLATFSWLFLAIKESRQSLSNHGVIGAPPWRYDVPHRGLAGEDETDSDDDGDRGRPINVLCMDGGGIRGRCLLAMVEEMELQLGGAVAKHFDLIAGTSIGGCGSIFLSRYPEAGQATRMARLALTELQTRCFAHRNWRRLLRRGFLCRDERRDFMLELCGTTQPLRTNGPRAFAVAARRDEDGLIPFLFRTYDLPPGAARRSRIQGTAQVALWQAIEATSAAPVLFPRAQLELEVDIDHAGSVVGERSGQSVLVGGGEGVNEGGGEGASDAARASVAAANSAQSGIGGAQVGGSIAAGSGEARTTVRTAIIKLALADGGLVANDPTAIALREARALWPNRPVGTVVSLGTGTTSPLGADAANEPARSPIGRAVRASGGPSASYYRLNPPVHGVSMIDSNEDKLRAMEDATRKYFRESFDAREACRRLVESRARKRSTSWKRAWPLTARVVNTVRIVRACPLALLMTWFEQCAGRAFSWLFALSHKLTTSESKPLPSWRQLGFRQVASSGSAPPALAMP